MPLLQTPVPGGERDLTINFYGTPKVPLYELAIDGLVAGEILDVRAEFVISARPYPLRAAFVASQVLLRDTPSDGLVNIPLTGDRIDVPNGFDISVPDHNAYARFVRTGMFQVPPEYAGLTKYMCVVGWASSDGAGRWDYLDIVQGYGRLSVLRTPPTS